MLRELYRKRGAARTRRGRYFEPKQLPGCRLWLRADRLVTVDTGKVTAWGDLSALGHNAVQAAGAKQPAFTASSLNGRPGIDFAGTDDCLRIAAMTYGGSAQVTLALVVRDTTNGDSAIVEGLAGSGNIFAVRANPVAIDRLWFYSSTATTENTGYIADSLATTRRLICTFDRSIVGGVGTLEQSLWVDGVATAMSQQHSQDNTGAFTDGALNLGARNDGAGLAWTGTMHEVVLWNRILSAADIRRVDLDLRTRWGL